MGFDLFQSRRNYNELCRWWARNENDDYEEDELIYKRIPSGFFYAKEINAETTDDNIIANIIMLDRTSVTIESPDNLEALANKKIVAKNRILVEYQGEYWRVENVQKRKKHIQNSEFANANNVSHFWYLSLIKG